MAYIGHLCACGDMDVNHAPADPTHPKKPRSCQIRAGGSCGRKCAMPKESTLRPTFDLKRREIERIVPPGETYGSPAGGVRTCDCPACQELYAELTAQAA